MARDEDPKTHTSDYIKGDWDKAVYLDSVHSDNLMTAFLNLGAEFWTMRRRMLVLEKFIAEQGVIDPAAVEAYVPTAEEKAAWEAERDAFIERTFSVLTRNTAAVPSEMPSQAVPPVKPGAY